MGPNHCPSLEPACPLRQCGRPLRRSDEGTAAPEGHRPAVRADLSELRRAALGQGAARLTNKRSVPWTNIRGCTRAAGGWLGGQPGRTPLASKSPGPRWTEIASPEPPRSLPVALRESTDLAGRGPSGRRHAVPRFELRTAPPERGTAPSRPLRTLVASRCPAARHCDSLAHGPQYPGADRVTINGPR